MSRLGDIIETSTTTFTTQCYNLYDSPVLGELVKTNGMYPTYAVAYNIYTEAIDPSRKPMARGHNENKEEDVYNNNPQLKHLLRTDFQSIIIGHKLASRMLYHLPPTPPQIYSFVHTCEEEDTMTITSNTSIIRTLATSNVPAIEEIISAYIRNASKYQEDNTMFFETIGINLASYFPGEFKKVESILAKAIT